MRELREKHNAAGADNCDIHKGDIVLVEDENVKRNQWKIGRIERLIVGKEKDGKIRGASVVKICKGKRDLLNRPITKLYPFEITGTSDEVGDIGNGDCWGPDLPWYPKTPHSYCYFIR